MATDRQGVKAARQRPVLRFEKRAREFRPLARLTPKGGSRSESKSPQPVRVRDLVCKGEKSAEGDPKPVDLCLGRLKPLERGVEDRTGADVQIVRMTWA